LKSSVRVWWYQNKGIFNFGDELGPYLVESLTGLKAEKANLYKIDYRKTYVIVGSVIHHLTRNCKVWGAGIIESKSKIPKAKYYAVRGPLTYHKIKERGIDIEPVFGDPALLLPKVYLPKVKKTHEIGIIPHISDQIFINSLPIDHSLFKIIDLRKPIHQVVIDILSCKATISSSLHGIITSHAYNIPSKWFQFKNELFGDNIKFDDYFMSVDITPYKAVIENIDNFNSNFIGKLQLSQESSFPKKSISIIGDQLLESCPLPLNKKLKFNEFNW